MTDSPFRYDEQLLGDCVSSSLASFLTSDIEEHHIQKILHTSSSTIDSVSTSDGNHPCVRLLHQHARHFGRAHAPDSIELRQISRNEEGSRVQFKVGNTLQTFVRNAVAVHKHNIAVQELLHIQETSSEEDDETKEEHFVTLNRFSDMDLNQVMKNSFFESRPNLLLKDTQNAPDLGRQSNRKLLHENTAQNLNTVLFQKDGSSLVKDIIDSTLTTIIDEEDDIVEVAANLAIGRGSMNHLNKHKIKRKKDKDEDETSYDIYPDTLDIPPDDMQMDMFETPSLNEDMNGVFLSIKRNKNFKYEDHNLRPSVHPKLKDDIQPTTNNTEGADPFSTYLNWATDANPDGVPLVNNPIDQGSCGSCWASAAAGSLEASAARKVAYDAYKGYMVENQQGQEIIHPNETLAEHEEALAVEYAQGVQRAAFKMLNLSIQELLDCDTAADQGCTGGNPLLSFFFIHRYGLTSWKKYPYIGYEAECQNDLVRKPVATVKSWGIVSPNHENHMELVLRYIGPIAAGFNGADPSFLAYAGGIYYKHKCGQAANHALLIVGYGQEERNVTERSESGEELNTTKITKYWIARNSWGTAWGENGFVRIRRGKGHKGLAGVCGVARSPSVALGGVLLKRIKHAKTPAEAYQDYISNITAGISAVVNDTNDSGDSDDTTILLRDTNSELYYDDSLGQKMCNSLGMSGSTSWCGISAAWIEGHHALAGGLLGIFCALLALWPLTFDCRRRRRRRLLRESMRRQQESERQFVVEQAQQAGDLAGKESTPMLGNGNSVSYGASA